MAGKHKILLVDDESKMLKLGQKFFGLKYDLLTFEDPLEALQAVESKGPVAVVLSDNRMPSMRGTEFLAKIKSLSPQTIRILMTAHHDRQLTEDAVNQGEIYRFLSKPLDFKKTKETLEAGIRQYDENLKAQRKEKDLKRLAAEKQQIQNKFAALRSVVARLTRAKKKLVGALVVVVCLLAGVLVVADWKVLKEPAPPLEKTRYWVRYDNETAVDTRTNLMWMLKDFRALEGRQPKGWKEAVDWAGKMNQRRYGGYNDWRLPTIAEYKQTFDPNRTRLGYDRNADYPVGYPGIFEDGGGYGYWSGEEIGPNFARYFFFIGGYSRQADKSYHHPTMSVRLVR